VRDGPRALAGPLTRQRQPEVGVVVHGVDGDRLGELPAGPRRAPGHVQRPGEGLADRRFLGLHQTGPGQQHGGLVGMALLEEPHPPGEQVVGGLSAGVGAIQS